MNGLHRSSPGPGVAGWKTSQRERDPLRLQTQRPCLCADRCDPRRPCAHPQRTRTPRTLTCTSRRGPLTPKAPCGPGCGGRWEAERRHHRLHSGPGRRGLRSSRAGPLGALETERPSECRSRCEAPTQQTPPGPGEPSSRQTIQRGSLRVGSAQTHPGRTPNVRRSSLAQPKHSSARP